jgi:hypothetical protein
VTDWYKQDVYDPSNRIDVLVSDTGQINALVAFAV